MTHDRPEGRDVRPELGRRLTQLLDHLGDSQPGFNKPLLRALLAMRGLRVRAFDDVVDRLEHRAARGFDAVRLAGEARSLDGVDLGGVAVALRGWTRGGSILYDLSH